MDFPSIARAVFSTNLLLALTSCTDSRQLPMEPATMSAPALQAGTLAFNDFANEQARERKGAGNDFQRYATSIDSYDVVFREGENTYSFTFRLKPYRGRPVKDGETTYEINKSDLKVSKTRFR